ncbi:MAG TPA: DNRLRE domain-containing protein, partial [Thermomicrobiales bacterium]|nr:DNRLRE domain-containing protein [Thermomicrobiales bacterium]
MTARFTGPLDPASLTADSFSLVPDAGGDAVAARLSYDASSQTASLRPAHRLAAGTTYIATLKGNNGGLRSAAGAALAADTAWSFSTTGRGHRGGHGGRGHGHGPGHGHGGNHPGQHGQHGGARANEAASATTLTFAPDADARVEEENPDANFGGDGGDKALQSDHLPMVESYLRFTVSGVSGQVVGATLRLHTSTYSGAVSTNGPAVYPAGNDWSEDGITWNDKPARTSGAPADDLAAIDGNDWASFDVSSLVNGDGVYTFDLASTSSDGAFFWSREAADGVRPELALTLAGSSTPSPTSTATPPENTPTPTPPGGSQALTFAPQADARVEANN